MKILFIMPNAHYVRNFESVIVALAGNGHNVALGLERGIETMPPEVQSFMSVLLTAHGDAIEIMALPERDSFWSGAAAQLRAWRDYSRYFLPRHARARRCAERAALYLIAPLQVLNRTPQPLREPLARLINRLCGWAEEVLPVDPLVTKAVKACAPDIVLVTPLIDINSEQVDYVKACRSLRVPIGHCVASWDNLTNKGVIKALPDRVFVWNEAQKAEAVEQHRVPPDRVVITGAQLFDPWFSWKPSRNRQGFCAEIGLDPSRPILLYTASSVFICRSEVEFVIRWLKAIRARGNDRMRDAQVIIRPHPKAAKTLGQWESEELQKLGGVVVYPRGGHMPLGVESRNNYYDSLYHSAAIIGVNTSAMLEAAIVGRRSFTVLLDELREGQDGMVHFQHLTQNGFLGVAESFDEHICQLESELDRPPGGDGTTDITRQFVGSFIRPYGLDEPGTPRFVTEVEKLHGLKGESRTLVARCGAVQRPLFLPFVFLAAHFDKNSMRRRRKRRKELLKSFNSFGRRARKRLNKMRLSRLVRALRKSSERSRQQSMPQGPQRFPEAGDVASSGPYAKSSKHRNRAAA